MFKVISAELKKVLSKPGIYVLSVFLAIILIIGVFIYNPKVSESTAISFENATNYIDKYNYFIGDDETNKTSGIKVEADKQVQLAIKNITNYSITSGSEKISKEQQIKNLINVVNEKFKEYNDCSVDGLDTTITATRNDLISALKNLNKAIEDGNNKASNGCYSIVMTKSVYQTYSSQYKEILNWAETVVQKENLADHCNVYSTKYKDNFINNINKFIYPTISDSFVNSYTIDSDGSSLHTLNIRLNAILDEIQTNLTLSQNDINGFNIQSSSKMNELATKYVDTCSAYANLIKYSLINNAFDKLSTSEQMDAMYLSNYSAYNCNSLQVRYEYLFKNNKTEADYARPLTIGITSNNDTNAYDYAYFVLKLFTIVIVAFAIMMACHTVAGEIKEGSMRYMAIRPVSRSKIIFGKYFSILILSTILSIFSSVIAIAVGGAVYGFGSLNILTIFNGSTAVVMHPIVMLIIYVVSMLIEVAIYTGIALMLSTIFKSDLMSVTLMLLFYLVNTFLPIIVTGVNSWLTFYPFSHINLYSLFGSSIYAIQGNFINALLGTNVYLTSGILATTITSVLLIIIPVFVAYKIFSIKEL